MDEVAFQMYRCRHRRTRRGVGAAAPPGLKIFRANSVFQGKRKLLKTPENKKYIFSTVNLGHPLFLRASASCSKILNDIKYFNRVKNSRETLPFRASASCSKLLNVCSENFQGNCVFFRASTSCSKILNDKKYIFNTEEKFQCNSVFHAQAQLAQNSECEKYVPYSGKFQGKLCFSGQAQVAQNS